MNKTKNELMNAWRAKLEEISSMGSPRLLPTSRRMVKDERHPYGWKVSYRQTVVWPDGQKARVYFSDIGTHRQTALANSLRAFNADEMSQHHPEAVLLYQAAKSDTL